MADSADIASAYIDAAISDQLEKLMRQNQQKVLTNKGNKTCVECGDDVPEPRRKLGFSLCITCAEEAERHKSRYA
jgi:RNA polymerase-binding transcription factor DksA